MYTIYLKKVNFIVLSIFSWFFLTSCFDYVEEIEFYEDFSGVAKISYIIPVNDKNKSLIAFLPSDIQSIKKSYAKPFQKKNFQITHYKVASLEGAQNSKIEYEMRKIKVSYTLFFFSPKALENTPLKNTTIYLSSNTLTIKKKIPSINLHVNEKKEKLNYLSERIKSYFLKRIGTNSLYYVFKISDNMNFESNQATLYEKIATYKIALSATLQNESIPSWNVKIIKK